MKQDYFDVLNQLRKHHSLFAQFWTVGNLIEIDHPSMPTAGIAFDKKTGEGLQFLINPHFWAALDDNAKAFVIGHEILHVYLDHGRRMIGLDPQLANVAQDVVINHQLCDIFGFDRATLKFAEYYCWRDTVFPGRKDIEEDRCFEYYYEKLVEQGGMPQDGEGEPGEKGKGKPGEGHAQSDGQGQGEPEEFQMSPEGNQTVDTHDLMENADQELLDAIQEAVEELVDRITPEEIENFEELIEKGSPEESKKLQAQHAGTMGGTMRKKIRLGKIVKKRTWEGVVSDILGRFGGMEREVNREVWTRDNRRIAQMGGDLILPADVDEIVMVRDRIDVWCFQDTSGSCESYAKRFFQALATIPDDRFRVRVFCFDTKVYETSLESGKLYGFGGTAFQPIENEIQRLIQTETRNGKPIAYPQAVFLVTDGYGSRVTPEHPDRWHWFMTDHHSSHHVPSESKEYKLSDYE
jgi:hypothetical protein